MISLTNLKKARKNFNDEIEKVENSIKEKIEFDFSISNLDGDGFCISDEEGNVGLLESCLAIIEKRGKLSQTDFLKLTF